ncbi:MAG: leucine-rich repeat domain-containing protein [Treponema sp.]|nr:leucine-rich repeat domain-containing protein [Treponema sp.]
MKKFLKMLAMLSFVAALVISCANSTDGPGASDYEEATVTITYSSAHGSNIPKDKTVEKGYALKASDLPELSEDGWNFDGWNKKVGDKINSDTTITAKWTNAIDGSSEPKNEDTDTEVANPDENLDATEGLEIKVLSKYCEVKGIGSYTGTEIVIPSTYEGKPVKEIADSAFENNTSITKVVIPSSVTQIGSYAFSGCTGLTEITIPESVTKIYSRAFSGCTALSNITINATLSSYSGSYIFENAGKDADSLTVEFTDKVTYIYNGCFSTSSNASNYITKLIIGKNVESISSESFKGATRLSLVEYAAANVGDLSSRSNVFKDIGKDTENGVKFVFKNSVEKIPSNFLYSDNYQLSNVTQIEFEENSSCTSIGDSAFYRSALSEVNLPDSVENIGSSAFEYSENIESIKIGENIKTIGQFAFYYCDNLKTVEYSAKSAEDFINSYGSSYNVFPYGSNVNFELTVKNTVESIPAYFMTERVGCTKVIFEENSSLRKISANAFYKAENITSCVLPDCVEEIGDNAFYGASKISDCKVPSSLKTLGKGAFYSVGFADAIVIPSAITEIPDTAFRATKATSISLPETLTAIGNSGIRDIVGIEEISLPVSLKTIGELALEGLSSVKNLVVPASVESIGKYAFSGMKALETAEIKCSITEIPDGLMNEAESLKTFSIPKTYTSIGACAFYKCKHLETFEITDKTTAIGKEAFAYCESLTSIFIPKSVATLGKCSFGWCYSATSLTIEEGTAIEEIPEECFTNLTSVVAANLPEGIKIIRKRAFTHFDSVSEITIPESVEILENEAFFVISKDVSSLTINYNAVNCSDNEERGEIFYISQSRQEKTVNIGENVTHIPAYTFSYVLATFSFKGNACKEIGTEAFRSTILQNSEFVIPSSVEVIGDRAFAANDYYTEITIPASVKKIGLRAFAWNGNKTTSGETKLSSLTFESLDGWKITANEDFTSGTDAELSATSGYDNAQLYNSNADKYWYKEN